MVCVRRRVSVRAMKTVSRMVILRSEMRTKTPSGSPLKGENPKSPFKGDLEGLPGVQTSRPRKLSYKEQRELAQLEQQMPLLEQEKATLEQQLSGGLTDPQAIAEASARYEEVQRALDEAELRWLELND